MEKNSYPMFINDFTKTSRIIYTPSAFARANLFTIQETGNLHALKAYMSKRSGLDSYLFFVVTSGSGSVSYGGEVAELTVGDCFFIDCRKAYSHCSSVNTPWSLSWVHFTGATLPAIYEKYIGRNGKPYFKTKNYTKYVSLIEDIYAIASSNSYVRDMQINTKLSELLEYIMTETVIDQYEKNYEVSPKKLNVQKAKQYIEDNYTENISLEKIADIHYINKNYLAKVFKEQYGITVNGYIMSLRVTKAKGLLRFSKMLVEQISYECGFTDSNYFSRIFKKIEGLSPSQYRKNWLSQN